MTGARPGDRRRRRGCGWRVCGWRAAPIAALAAVALVCGCDRATTAAARVVGLVPFETACVREVPPTRIEVTTADVNYGIDMEHTIAELTSLSPESTALDHALGLTLTQFGYENAAEMRGIEESRGGRVCVRPAIRITLVMKPMTVFVAREFKGDACREAVILEHERKHVAVYSDFMKELARELREAITAEFGDSIFYATDRAGAEREIRDRLSVYLEPMLHEAMRRVHERQRTVDSPEEYARVEAACGGMKID